MSISNQYVKDYGDLLLNGLDSRQTYVVLRQNKTQGLNVAIRPAVERVGPNVVLFGGKFRVGYTTDDSYNIIKSKVVTLNPVSRETAIRDFCKGFLWQRVDQRRSSTVLGFGVAGSQYDRQRVIDDIVEGNLALEFVNQIDAKYKQYNDVGFQNKRKAAAAIQAAWLIQLETSFTVPPQAEFLPEEVVGTRSKLLNKAQDNHTDNVISFKEAVAAKVAKANSE